MALFRGELDSRAEGIDGSLEQRWADIQTYGLGETVAFMPSDLILKINDLTWELIREGLICKHDDNVGVADTSQLTEVEVLA